MIYFEDHIYLCEVSLVYGRCLDKQPPDAMLRTVFWVKKVRLASYSNFASASIYGVPDRMVRKALFCIISIFFDRYFGRLLCQITHQYSRTERIRA